MVKSSALGALSLLTLWALVIALCSTATESAELPESFLFEIKLMELTKSAAADLAQVPGDNIEWEPGESGTPKSAIPPLTCQRISKTLDLGHQGRVIFAPQVPGLAGKGTFVFIGEDLPVKRLDRSLETSNLAVGVVLDIVPEFRSDDITVSNIRLQTKAICLQGGPHLAPVSRQAHITSRLKEDETFVISGVVIPQDVKRWREIQGDWPELKRLQSLQIDDSSAQVVLTLAVRRTTVSTPTGPENDSAQRRRLQAPPAAAWY